MVTFVLELEFEFEPGSVVGVATVLFVQLTQHSTNSSTRIMQIAFFIFPLFPPIFLFMLMALPPKSFNTLLQTKLFTIIGDIALKVRDLLIHLKNLIVLGGVRLVFLSCADGFIYLEKRCAVFP